MGRIGSLPSVPNEFLDDVVATSWSITTDAGIALDSGHGDPSAEAVLRELKWDAPSGHFVRFVTTTSPETPFSSLPDLLLETSAQVVVIVDESHRPLGIVTPAHVLRAVRDQPTEELAKLSALDVATSGGALLPETTSLRIAARRLREEDREFMPVVAEGGTLVGIITANDLLIAIGGV